MEENNNKLNNIKTIHTYESDMADLMREQQGSVIKIALAEQKKKEVDNIISERKITNPKNIIFVISGIVLIALAIWGASFLIKKSRNQAVVQPEITKPETQISYDSQSTLDVTNVIEKSVFAKMLQSELGGNIKSGGIKVIFLNANLKYLNTTDFLNLINLGMPGSLSRSLSDQFMIGVFSPTSNSQLATTDRKNDLFFIFQTKNYNQTYAGMLEWEKSMISDLFPLFGIDITGNRQTLLSTQFKDVIISNKDARVLRDSNGIDVLYYLFMDNKNFIIAKNKDTIKEVLSRLVVKNIKPL